MREKYEYETVHQNNRYKDKDIYLNKYILF